jgi:hypothetical protein
LSIYIIVFLLLVLSVFIESFGDKISATLFLIVSLVLLLFITSNREGIGTDFYNYKEIYGDITIDNSFSVEFGFVILNYIAYYIGGFKVLLFITAFLNLFAIIFVLRRLKLHTSLGVLTYYSLFYLNHNFNTVRHGLMTAFVWIALYFYFKRDKIKSIFFYVVSILFHQLAFVFYPLQFLTLKRINYKYSIILLFILFIVGKSLENSFVFLNVFISQYSNKLNYYLNDYYGDEIVRYQFGLGFFLYLVIYFLILKFEDYFTNRTQIVFFNRLLFLGISMIILFASISIFSERIANTLLLSLVFIFASFEKIKIELLPRFILLFVFVAIDFFYLMKILSIPGIDRIYQFVPYTYTFF